MENELHVTYMGKPSRKHAIKHKLRYLGAVTGRQTRNVALELQNAVTEAVRVSELKDFDKRHGTQLYHELLAKRRAEKIAAMRRLYGL